MEEGNFERKIEREKVISAFCGLYFWGQRRRERRSVKREEIRAKYGNIGEGETKGRN